MSTMLRANFCSFYCQSLAGKEDREELGVEDGEQRITMASFLSEPSCRSAAYHCWDTYDHDPHPQGGDLKSVTREQVSK